jgi:hypothetical protein
MFRFVAVCCGTASGEPVPFNGQYLQAFDPNIRFEDLSDANTIGHFTSDLGMALRFRHAPQGLKWLMQTPRLVPEYLCRKCYWRSAYETPRFAGIEVCPQCLAKGIEVGIEFAILRGWGNCPLAAFSWEMVDMLEISEGKWKRPSAPSLN